MPVEMYRILPDCGRMRRSLEEYGTMAEMMIKAKNQNSGGHGVIPGLFQQEKDYD